MGSEIVYHSPKSVTAAVALLAEMAASGTKARVMAGGTALVPEIRERPTEKVHLVSLRHIGRLRRVQLADDQITVGALVTVSDLVRSPEIQRHAPVLTQAASKVAGVQIRNMVTVGGNLCHAMPYADLAVALLVMDAIVHFQSSTGEYTTPLDKFFTGPGQTSLKSDEIVTGISFERATAAASAVYIKHTLRQAMAIGIVNLALTLKRQNGRCKDVRLALGAVAPTPMRALRAESAIRGKVLSDDLINRAAELAAAECQPEDDIRGSAWYRRRMVKVLTNRAFRQLT